MADSDSPERIRTRNRYLGSQPSNADDGDTDDPELEPQFRKRRKRGGAAEGECAPPRADRARRGGKLTAAARQALPRGDFALPGKGEGPKGAGAGAYPIPDEAHARNALSRVSQHGSPGEKAQVRAKVHAKYPDIGKG